MFQSKGAAVGEGGAKAYVMPDFSQRHGVFAKELFCAFDAVAIDEIGECFAKFFFEQRGGVGTVGAQLACEMVDAEVGVEVALAVFDDTPHFIFESEAFGVDVGWMGSLHGVFLEYRLRLVNKLKS